MGDARVSWLGQLQRLSTRNYAMGHIRLMLAPMVVPTIIIAEVLYYIFCNREIYMGKLPYSISLAGCVTTVLLYLSE